MNSGILKNGGRGETKNMALTTALTCQYEIEPTQRCGRPALRRMRYCYFHQRDHKRNSRKRAERAHQRWFESVNKNDPAAIRRALAEILRRLSLDQIDHDKAGQMLFELQTAALTLPTAHEDSSNRS
jgi:hypothetical protein